MAVFFRLFACFLFLAAVPDLSVADSNMGRAISPRVVFISPSVKEHPFWSEATRCMKAAADDLAMNFQVVYPKVRNRISVHEGALEIINSDIPPEYIVFIYYKNYGAEILEKAEKKGIISFIFNTNIPPEEKDVIGEPGERFKNWIGHLTVNDEQAGNILAQALIAKARQDGLTDENGKIHMIAISGGKEASAAIERNKGLASVVDRLGDVLLHQVVFAYWKPERAAFITNGLLKRYPKTQVIWAASDAMALSAVRTARKVNSDRTYISGGIDWTTEGIEGVRTGELAITVGGHFMDGAWALVLIHDHYHGQWPGEEKQTMKTGMTLISDKNISSYLSRFKHRDWRKIDFTKYSRVYHPEQANYHFSLQDL